MIRLPASEAGVGGFGVDPTGPASHGKLHRAPLAAEPHLAARAARGRVLPRAADRRSDQPLSPARCLARSSSGVPGQVRLQRSADPAVRSVRRPTCPRRSRQIDPQEPPGARGGARGPADDTEARRHHHDARRHACDHHRLARGLSPRRRLRPDRLGALAARRQCPRFLDRDQRHHPVRGDAWLVAHLGHGPADLLGHADHGAAGATVRPARPGGARRDDRRPVLGLRQDRACQGPARAAGHLRPRAPQFDARPHHGRRATKRRASSTAPSSSRPCSASRASAS